MKAFVKHILKIVFVLIVCAYALDFVFTYVYQNSAPQNKAQYISSLQNQNFDYIFIGSSRVENSVIPEIIEQKIKKKTINLGVQGATIKDLVFITNWLQAIHVKYKKVFFQLDYKINDVSEYSKKFHTELFPFLGTNKTIDSYVYHHNKNKTVLKYIPFGKYVIAAHNLGFRNMVVTIFGFKNKIANNKGFVPLVGSGKMNSELLPKYTTKNLYLHELLKTKKAVFFSCPLFSTIKTNYYFQDIKKAIPSFFDFSSSVKEKEFFKDSYHLNTDGAVVFTNSLISKLKL